MFDWKKPNIYARSAPLEMEQKYAGVFCEESRKKQFNLFYDV